MSSCPIQLDKYCNSDCGWYNFNRGQCSMLVIAEKLGSLTMSFDDFLSKMDDMLQRNIQFVI